MATLTLKTPFKISSRLSSGKEKIHNAISQIYFVLLNDFDNAIEQAQSAFLANNSPTFYSDLSVLFFKWKSHPKLLKHKKPRLIPF